MLRLLAALAACVLAAGCGLPEDDQPRVVTQEDAPLTLVPEVTTTTVMAEGAAEVELYFVATDGRLRAVDREVSERTPRTVLEVLIDGPTAVDPAGLTSSIPTDTELLGATRAETTLTVDLGPATAVIFSIGGAQQLTAFGQIVLTAVELPNVDSVRFLLEGAPFSVPTDEGTSAQPVTARDYASLQPP
ncbi:MAG: GerMN domain-containing protein [Acidimicrobiales bacterium]